MIEVFGYLLILLIPMFLLQYFFVLKPTKKRIDIWLEQQRDKKKGS